MSVPPDLIVLGSGVAGLTAALSAALAGLRVQVFEHADQIGGTSARSSGTVWIPGNHYIASPAKDLDEARDYLASLVGNRGEPAIWNAFLENAPRMLADLDDKAGIRFKPYMAVPDYRQDHPGAASGGRPLEPLPFDGRTLAGDFSRLASPLPELMLFGGMMITRGEAAQLLKADRSFRALGLGLRLLGRYVRDRMRYPRGTRLVMGNALVARLLKALQDQQVPVLTGVKVSRLLQNHGRITGVEMMLKGQITRMESGRGVILAGGGFPANAHWRSEHLPEPVAQHTPAAAGCDGTTLELALAVGAALGASGLDNALWFPSSTMTRKDGSTAVYPHILLDRAKPGLIAVNKQGRRFVNEAVSYHEFVRAMYRKHAGVPGIPAWLICDSRCIRRYGLGLIRPRALSLRRFIDCGYLLTAASIKELADAIGVSDTSLQETVARFNGFAEAGKDKDFDKGGNIYDRSNGDPEHLPNPCIGPVAKPPFFAVQVQPTPLATARGLLADTHARVCDAAGTPIPGLYVCGNDMQSVFGGEYPGAGGQLGPAMTFAWIAARHAKSTEPASRHASAGQVAAG